MGGSWWRDDSAMRAELLAAVGGLERVCLDGLPVVAPRTPGAYLVFLAAPRLIPKLSELVAMGMVPAYAGVAKRSLKERVGRYRTSLQGMLDPEEVHFALLPTVSSGAALYAEDVFIAALAPIFNGTAFGSKIPGARRAGQRISLVDALLSRRAWARTPSPVEEAVAHLRILGRLLRMGPNGPRWPALSPSETRGPVAAILPLKKGGS